MLPSFCLAASSFVLAAVTAPPAPPAPPDIRDIVAPQPYFVQGSGWLLLVAGLCALAAAAVGWLLFVNFRQKNVKAPPSPREVAGKRLEQLLARLDETDARAFGAEAADILRAFIGAQYHLHAERQTSSEFLESIRGWTYFSAVQHAILEEFLTRCDLLKFARLDATRDAKLRLVDQAAQFLAAESPVIPAGTPGVLRPEITAPPPPALPSALPGFEAPDARYMPPAMRQTALPPTVEPATSATES